jgi:hypothetical protein
VICDGKQASETLMYRSKDPMTEGLTIAGLYDLRRWMTFIEHADFEDLRGVEVRHAIKQLRRIGRPAALALARELRLAQSEVPVDWYAVYRPLFVLESLGPMAAPAVFELIDALEDPHSGNVLLAGRAIGRIGPLAGLRETSLRSLRRQWRLLRGIRPSTSRSEPTHRPMRIGNCPA